MTNFSLPMKYFYVNQNIFTHMYAHTYDAYVQVCVCLYGTNSSIKMSAESQKCISIIEIYWQKITNKSGSFIYIFHLFYVNE